MTVCAVTVLLVQSRIGIDAVAHVRACAEPGRAAVYLHAHWGALHATRREVGTALRRVIHGAHSTDAFGVQPSMWPPDRAS